MTDSTTIFLLLFIGVIIMIAVTGWVIFSVVRTSSSMTKSLSQQGPLSPQGTAAYQAVEIACSKCGASMEEGFIPEYTHHEVILDRWVRGKPKLHWLAGIDLKGQEKLFITTYRCRACGYLEAYARN